MVVVVRYNILLWLPHQIRTAWMERRFPERGKQQKKNRYISHPSRWQEEYRRVRSRADLGNFLQVPQSPAYSWCTNTSAQVHRYFEFQKCSSPSAPPSSVFRALSCGTARIWVQGRHRWCFQHGLLSLDSVYHRDRRTNHPRGRGKIDSAYKEQARLPPLGEWVRALQHQGPLTYKQLLRTPPPPSLKYRSNSSRMEAATKRNKISSTW